MQSKNQYLKALIEKEELFFKIKTLSVLKATLSVAKKEKSRFLDEYCQTTGQDRKIFVIF
jgi:hypothetical protein